MMDNLAPNCLLASLFNYPRLRSNHFMCTPFHTRQLLNLRISSLQFTSEPQKSNNPISIDDGAHSPMPPLHLHRRSRWHTSSDTSSPGEWRIRLPPPPHTHNPQSHL